MEDANSVYRIFNLSNIHENIDTHLAYSVHQHQLRSVENSNHERMTKRNVGA